MERQLLTDKQYEILCELSYLNLRQYNLYETLFNDKLGVVAQTLLDEMRKLTMLNLDGTVLQGPLVFDTNGKFTSYEFEKTLEAIIADVGYIEIDGNIKLSELTLTGFKNDNVSLVDKIKYFILLII